MASLGGWLSGFMGMDKYGDMTDREIALLQQKEMTDYNAQVNKEYNEYMAKNQMSWQVEGLQNAGLNPVLAATGGINGATSAGAIQQGHVPSTNENSLTSALKVGMVVAGAVTGNMKLISIGLGTPVNQNKTNNYNNYNNNSSNTNSYYNNKFYKQK